MKETFEVSIPEKSNLYVGTFKSETLAHRYASSIHGKVNKVKKRYASSFRFMDEHYKSPVK